MASTSWWITPRLRFGRRLVRDRDKDKVRARARRDTIRTRVRRILRRRVGVPPPAKREARRSESFPPIYFAAGGDFAVDGRHPARGLCRLSSVTGLGVAGGRLPHHLGGHVLSGCPS